LERPQKPRRGRGGHYDLVARESRDHKSTRVKNHFLIKQIFFKKFFRFLKIPKYIQGAPLQTIHSAFQNKNVKNYELGLLMKKIHLLTENRLNQIAISLNMTSISLNHPLQPAPELLARLLDHVLVQAVLCLEDIGLQVLLGQRLDSSQLPL